jgi:hypothetical protein
MASGVIFANGTQSGNQPRIRRLAEKAAQTFLMGVPVQFDPVAGGVKEWDGVTVAAGIAGVSKEPASNLAATGVKQFQVLANNPVPNQPLAQKIVRGAPYNDGRIGFELADSDIQFWAQVGPLQTQADVVVTGQYGMTKDADGHWYVDKTKVGAAAVCQVVRLDTIDAVRGVWIAFLPTAQQILL